MNWNRLESKEGLDDIVIKSTNSPIVIFKHSTRCSISSIALNRLSSAKENNNYNLLDIIAYREISNEVASRFNVIHQSPQVLIIYHGKCIFNTSHLGISSSAVEKQLALVK